MNTAHVSDLRRCVVTVAVNVGDRPFVRAAFTALSWFVRHPAPEAFFDSRGQALSHCWRALRAQAAPGPTE